MAVNITPDRSLLIRSRLAEGYHWSEVSLKNLQHVLTDWFPAAIYTDLTADTVRVDVTILKDFSSGKDVFNAVFLGADNSEIKRTEYLESKLIGKSCPQYDKRKTRYDGKKDGYDHRLAYYAPVPAQGVSRSK